MLEVIEINTRDIKPFPQNAKKHPPEQIEQIRRSITEFGMNDPIAIDEQNVVIEGHGRLLALKAIHAESVPCIRLSHLTEEQKHAYILAHNKLTLNSGFDSDLLLGELDFLRGGGFDVSLTGFDAVEMEDLFKGKTAGNVQEDNFDAEKAAAEIETPVSPRGDIWLLGRHRLRCGDSTCQADVDLLLNGEKAKLLLTDAPYNVSYGHASHPSWKQRSILNDSMSPERFGLFLRDAFTCAFNAVEPGAAVYAFMSAQEWGRFMPTLEAIGWHWSSTIIWAKDTLVLGRKDWQPRYEGIYYGWHSGAPRLYPLKENRKETDVWEFDRPKRSPLHPTQKPLDVLGKAIHYSSRVEDIVLDLFGGSASTLIAADQMGRTAYLQEMDPKYVDVGVTRFIGLKGSAHDVFLLRGQEKLPYDAIVR